MAREEHSYEAKDFGWLVAMSLWFFVLVALALWYEFRPEWRQYQDAFPALLGHYGRVEDARKFEPGIRQIWNPDIGVVDRCITCHLGYEWGSVLPATLPEPFAPHPQNQWVAMHPFEKFGCTPCHGGQGWATSAVAAHTGGPGWGDPLITPAVAMRYGLSAGDMIQMRCNFCHRHDAATPGMDKINLGKKLIKHYKCLVCHEVEGTGGTKAPELTYEGDKNPELFDFSHVRGGETLFNWNMQHLIEAGKISPGTQMPDFGMPESDARALTLLIFSWKRVTFPPEYVPAPEAAAAAIAAPVAAASPSAAPSAAPSR